MKSLKIFVLSLFAFVGCFCFVGCGCSAENPTTYKIQYDDSNGNSTIEVKLGEPYSLPTTHTGKIGYEFLGWFDAENGGTKYVNSSGSAISVFNDKKNIILHAQYQPLNIELNFVAGANAEINGSNQLNMLFNDTLSELSTTAVKYGYDFNGWFTQENGGGIKVADNNGWLAGIKTFNQTNFNVTQDNLNNGTFNLYAHFTITKFSVEFNITDSLKKVLSLDYETILSDVKIDTIYDVCVSSWSTTRNDDYANNVKEKVDGNLILYPTKRLLTITLTSSGSECKDYLVEMGGNVTLPTPAKDSHIFKGWYDENNGYGLELTDVQTNYALVGKWNKYRMETVKVYSFEDDCKMNTAENHRMPTEGSKKEKEIMSIDMPQNTSSITRYINKISYDVRNDNDVNLHQVRVSFYKSSNFTSTNKIGDNFCTNLTVSNDMNKGVYHHYEINNKVLVDFDKMHLTCSDYPTYQGVIALYLGRYVINNINFEYMVIENELVQ